MSAIIDNANDVRLVRAARIRRSISNSGFARQEIGSPSFYSLECDLPLMSGAKYLEIEAELINLFDGASFVTTKLPDHLEVLRLRGSFEATAGNTATIVSNTGNTVTINKLVIGTTLLAGDFIQFDNSTKVYQVYANTTADATGTMIVTLHTGLITSPLTTSGIRTGNNVFFRFLLQGRPEVNITPGHGTNLYTYGTFSFREVL